MNNIKTKFISLLNQRLGREKEVFDKRFVDLGNLDMKGKIGAHP